MCGAVEVDLGAAGLLVGSGRVRDLGRAPASSTTGDALGRGAAVTGATGSTDGDAVSTAGGVSSTFDGDGAAFPLDRSATIRTMLDATSATDAMMRPILVPRFSMRVTGPAVMAVSGP